jgi:hypothetical protein
VVIREGFHGIFSMFWDKPWKQAPILSTHVQVQSFGKNNLFGIFVTSSVFTFVPLHYFPTSFICRVCRHSFPPPHVHLPYITTARVSVARSLPFCRIRGGKCRPRWFIFFGLRDVRSPSKFYCHTVCIILINCSCNCICCSCNCICIVQPLTEMSTRNLKKKKPGGKVRPARRADNLPPSVSRLSK